MAKKKNTPVKVELDGSIKEAEVVSKYVIKLNKNDNVVAYYLSAVEAHRDLLDMNAGGPVAYMETL